VIWGGIFGKYFQSVLEFDKSVSGLHTSFWMVNHARAAGEREQSNISKLAEDVSNSIEAQ